MSEFTKDELKFIWNRLALWDYKNSPEMLELPDKVHSMIENYCEHLWDDAASNQFYCIKCQKHIDKVG
jgi:hypothetical protein